MLSSVKRIWDNVLANQNLGHFLTLFVFILYLEIIGVLLEVLDDMKVVPRVNHRPQPLLARLLRVDPAHLGWVGSMVRWAMVDPEHLRSGKRPHIVHHPLSPHCSPVFSLISLLEYGNVTTEMTETEIIWLGS